jgi:hypothetical protein
MSRLVVFEALPAVFPAAYARLCKIAPYLYEPPRGKVMPLISNQASINIVP